MATVAIGDVHGRSDLLAELLDRLPEAPQLIMLGDYVDRGDDSRGVLEQLITLPAAICLRGNHEQMMLDFLEMPERHGPRWLRIGGLQTLQSFAITGATQTSSAQDLWAIADDFRAALGEPMLAWLNALPTSYRSGNVLFTHAGANPDLPSDAQKNDALLWGHPKFLSRRRTDGLWVVHGHTVVAEAEARSGRISVDTGAFATGRLSAVCLGSGPVSFLTT